MSNAGRILRLAGRNYIAGLPEHHREAATSQLNVIVAAADRFNAELAAVNDNDELSPVGRKAEVGKVMAAAYATLNAIEVGPIKTLTERATTLEAALLKAVTLSPPTDPAERVAFDMRCREIRDSMRGMSAIERLNAYRLATDPTILAAIETAPPTTGLRADGSRRLEPFVDADEMRVAKLERAASADAATATTLREVRSLREVYSLAVNSVKQEIEQVVNQPAQAVSRF